MIEKPEAIMMNMPDSFFQDCKINYDQFIHYYDSQSKRDETWCFYHFISNIPVHEVVNCFLCFGGKVRMKVHIVEFLRKQAIKLPDFDYPFPRNWMVATGPITLPPEEISQKGFRGFRYTSMLF